MALEDDIQILQLVPLFAGFGEDKIRLMAFGAERRHIESGQTLFRQGARADCAFVVMEGSIALSQTATDNSVQEKGTATRGALLSELALVSAVDRKLTAIANEPTTVMRITRQLFHRVLEEYPEIGEIFRDRLSRQLNQTLDELSAITYQFRD